MMTREDMMRELELLPVWQSRALVSEVKVVNDVSRVITKQDAELKSKLPVKLVNVAVEELSVSLDESLEILTPAVIEQASFTHIMSEDGKCLFVLPNAVMSADELQLFQNICKALRIKTKAAETSSDIFTSISGMQTQLLLVMGEAVAQMILQSAEPIAKLRSTPHELYGVALIATYGLQHLLQNPADKAKVWRDLCEGLQTLQDLKVTNN